MMGDIALPPKNLNEPQLNTDTSQIYKHSLLTLFYPRKPVQICGSYVFSRLTAGVTVQRYFLPRTIALPH